MKKNVGSTEQINRIMAGIAIISLAFVGPKSAWAYLGIVPLQQGSWAGARRTLFSAFPAARHSSKRLYKLASGMKEQAGRQ